jgi:hypothetical protein
MTARINDTNVTLGLLSRFVKDPAPYSPFQSLSMNIVPFQPLTSHLTLAPFQPFSLPLDSFRGVSVLIVSPWVGYNIEVGGREIPSLGK